MDLSIYYQENQEKQENHEVDEVRVQTTKNNKRFTV